MRRSPGAPLSSWLLRERIHDHDYWRRVQFWAFVAMMRGFAIKVPLFPVHTWLPLAHTEAPTAGSVILAGVLLKLGTYGLLKLALPIGLLGSDLDAPLYAGRFLGVLWSYTITLRGLIAFSTSARFSRSWPTRALNG